MRDKQAASTPQPSLQRAIVLALLLVVCDAFLLNQGAVALLVGLWLLFVGLPRTFLAKKYVTVRPQRLRNIAIYLVAVILVFALNAANNRVARARAEDLIAVVKAFHAKYQRYPKSLEELVPNYLERVPVAKYTLIFNRFWYMTSVDYTSLFYVDFPPFGRPTYSFTHDKWRYLD
ncbi:MAG: hypothetical protein ABIH03_01720 [Pseudomonadota bacterium]